jgi:spore germination protein GerM
MKIPSVRLIHREAFAGLLLLLLSATGVGAWWAWRSKTFIPVSQSAALTQVQKHPVDSPIVKAPPVQPQPEISPVSKSPTIGRMPEIYRLRVENQQVRLTPTRIALDPRVSSEVALTQAMNKLLSTPQTADLSSTIPSGTRLLSLRVTPQGIYVNLSREFTQGGGSDSMINRVAQVLYTATSLDPTTKVYLLVEGQPLDENHPLGGEGVILQQPLTRQQLAADFKDILH